MNDRSGVLSLHSVPAPVPVAGEVLIEVAATAVNRADLMQCEGHYPPPPGWPAWPGLEVAGTVLQAPDDSRFRRGDPVCALLGGGGYAEQVVVPEGLVIPIPLGVSCEEAAALPEVFATAYLNFVVEAQLQPGETLFLQAGASGLGLASIQLAKLLGAKVVTTVGSEAKAARVREEGADVAINHRTESIVDALRQHPPDVALDCVAGEGVGSYLECLKPGGRWIVIAALGGSQSVVSFDTVFRRNLRVIGSTLRSRSMAQKAEIMQALEQLFSLHLPSGRLRANLHAILPMEKAAEGHEILRRRENIGKVVLSWD